MKLALTLSFLWGFSATAVAEIVLPEQQTCPDQVSKFGVEEAGSCLTAQGLDQNAGVIRLQYGTFDTPEAKLVCLEMCACYPGATGCEMIWDRSNRGCYVHTQPVARGTGSPNHSCYIGPEFNEATHQDTCVNDPFPVEERGNCVLGGPLNTAPDRSDVVQLVFGSAATRQSCLDLCSCYPGATACEVHEGSGCFVHTAPVDTGNGSGSVSCFLSRASGSCFGDHAGFWGDPHFTTFDGLRYDCQGAGEFVLAKSTGADPLLITGRFIKSSSPGRTVTVGRAVGIKVDENVPTIQVSTQESGQCTLEFTYGDNQAAVPSGDVTFFQQNYPNKARAYVDNDRQNAVFVFPGYSARVNVNVRSTESFGCMMRVDLCLTPENHGGGENIVGLFGSPTGNMMDDWMPSEENGGTLIGIPFGNTRDMYAEAYDFCMSNWCIGNAAGSLFNEVNFNTHNFCQERNFDAGSFVELLSRLPPIIVNGCAEADNPEECQLDAMIAVVERGEDPVQCIEGIKSSDFQMNELMTIEESELQQDSGRDGWCRQESGTNGDPHFKTWKNEHFEYHGQCDMVLLKDTSFAQQGINIQIRTKLVRYWSYIKQVAIQIGNDILEIQGSGDLGGNHNYWINYEYRGDLDTLGGFPITMNPSGDHYTIDLGNLSPGQKIVLKHHKEFVGVDFIKGTKASFGKTVGILGDFETGKTLARDGVTELHDFSEFGSEWQVLPSDGMLFHEISTPQFPTPCIEPENPRGQRHRRRLGGETVSMSDAEAACSKIKDALDQKDCVFDVLATQDVELAGAY